MKSVTGLFLFLLIPLLVPSQILSQQAETLFDNQISHGGFGSLVFGLTSVNGQATICREHAALGFCDLMVETPFNWGMATIKQKVILMHYTGINRM